MLDVRTLAVGDIFYCVYGYELFFELEMVKLIYMADKIKAKVKHLNNIKEPGRTDFFSQTNQQDCEFYFQDKEEALSYYNNCRIKELERLKDIDILSDELYKGASILGITEKEEILLEAINAFKASR